MYFLIAIYSKDRYFGIVTMYHKLATRENQYKKGISDAEINSKTNKNLVKAKTFTKAPKKTAEDNLNKNISKKSYKNMNMKGGFISFDFLDGLGSKYKAMIDDIVNDLLIENLSKLKKRH
jgi:hypothetical protein